MESVELGIWSEVFRAQLGGDEEEPEEVVNEKASAALLSLTAAVRNGRQAVSTCFYAAKHFVYEPVYK